MKAEEYFLIRPTDFAHRRLQELGIEFDDELLKPTVWCQSFDQRAVGSQEFSLYVLSSVKLWFLASTLSQIRRMSIHLTLSLTEFDQYWLVEWIGRNIVEADDIEGDLLPEVLEELADESTQGNTPAASDFANLIQRVGGVIR